MARLATLVHGTRRPVRAFQSKKLLAVTGRADAATWNAIWAAAVT